MCGDNQVRAFGRPVGTPQQPTLGDGTGNTVAFQIDERAQSESVEAIAVLVRAYGIPVYVSLMPMSQANAVATAAFAVAAGETLQIVFAAGANAQMPAIHLAVDNADVGVLVEGVGYYAAVSAIEVRAPFAQQAR